jgi:hypothetical protein
MCAGHACMPPSRNSDSQGCGAGPEPGHRRGWVARSTAVGDSDRAPTDPPPRVEIAAPRAEAWALKPPILSTPSSEGSRAAIGQWPVDPPPPPSRTLSSAPQPVGIGPPWGPISPVFWALRCKVLGGWGGSAHYPDPTAQSARRVAKRPGPRASLPPPQLRPPKLPKIHFFFSVVVESCCCARRERRSASIASRCVPCPAGAPLRLVMPNG